MNWSRIKSILIAVFIILDVYLLIQYFNVNDHSEGVSSTTIENTVTFLKKSEITIDPDIIPIRTEKSPKTGEDYRSGADALITFADHAKKDKITPCKIKEMGISDGMWVITTNKGSYSFSATTLNRIE